MLVVPIHFDFCFFFFSVFAVTFCTDTKRNVQFYILYMCRGLVRLTKLNSFNPSVFDWMKTCEVCCAIGRYIGHCCNCDHSYASLTCCFSLTCVDLLYRWKESDNRFGTSFAGFWGMFSISEFKLKKLFRIFFKLVQK